MKGFNDVKWFWIIYCAIFLAIGWGMASCNDTANAVGVPTMHGDTHSYTQLIDLDLNVARVDQQHKVTARQIFYDIGSDPSKTGYITVKINSTQSAPISMTPGGEINYDGIEEIYVSNAIQLGKSVKLLANNNATIKNPPSNPLTSGIPRTTDFVAATVYHLYTDFLAGQQLTGFIINPSNNTKGIMIHRLDASVVCNDYRDSAVFYIYDATKNVYLLTLKGSQRDHLQNIYLRPGTGLVVIGEVTTSGAPQATFIGTVSVGLTVIYQEVI